MINLGGNVLCIGNKPDGSSYNIGILKPFSDGEMVYKISVSDKGCTTSGIYQRYVEIDNKIYSHLIDNTTGYPIENQIYSSSVISNKSIIGDVLSTTTMLIGQKETEDMIFYLKNQYNTDLEIIFVDSDLNTYNLKN